MKRALIFSWLLLTALTAHAGDWEYEDKIAVSPLADSKVFQHLDATGRKSMAVSGQHVAVVWEDNRSGSPQAYIAFKHSEKNNFTEARRLSAGQAAYAPTIAALPDDRFLVGWEQDGTVRVRTVSPQAMGPVLKLGSSGSTQIALALHDGQFATLAWCQPKGSFNQIVAQDLKVHGDKVERLGATKPVDRKPPSADQSYPSVAVTAEGSVIAWEDRRHQHTILLYSHAPRGGAYSEPRALNEVVQKSARYGRGSGVTRVALDAYGKNNVVATWMDKRGEMTGYDIYAAFSRDGGRRFGANELVLDAFADNYAQWHPAVAADNAGRVVVAWDDDRDEVSNVFLAWKTSEGWSENLVPPPVASSEGDKTNPVIVLDARGKLHMLWLHQATPGGQPRIMYVGARITADIAQNP